MIIARMISVQRFLCVGRASDGEVWVNGWVGNMGLGRGCHWEEKSFEAHFSELWLSLDDDPNIGRKGRHGGLPLRKLIGPKEILRLFLRKSARTEIDRGKGDTVTILASPFSS